MKTAGKNLYDGTDEAAHWATHDALGKRVWNSAWRIVVNDVYRPISQFTEIRDLWKFLRWDDK